MQGHLKRLVRIVRVAGLVQRTQGCTFQSFKLVNSDRIQFELQQFRDFAEAQHSCTIKAAVQQHFGKDIEAFDFDKFDCLDVEDTDVIMVIDSGT